MPFYIKFLPEQTGLGANAEICLEDFKEEFCAAWNYWSQREYRQQWISAIEALLEGSEKEALITSYSGPTDTAITVWPLYREGGIVHVRNSLIFPERYKMKFDPEEVTLFVHDREVVPDEPVSEWDVPLSSFQEFIDQQ